jgi:hypothetical protein
VSARSRAKRLMSGPPSAYRKPANDSFRLRSGGPWPSLAPCWRLLLAYGLAGLFVFGIFGLHRLLYGRLLSGASMALVGFASLLVIPQLLLMGAGYAEWQAMVALGDDLPEPDVPRWLLPAVVVVFVAYMGLGVVQSVDFFRLKGWHRTRAEAGEPGNVSRS